MNEWKARVGRNSSDDRQISDEGYAHDDPVVDAALEWFTRLRNVEPDTATRKEFEAWLTAHPRHVEEFRAFEEMWGAKPFLSAVAALDTPQLGAYLLEKTTRKKSSRWMVGASAAAAIMLVALGAWQFPSIFLAWQADYMTATGSQSTVALPDGSTMVLNTASAVTVDFSDGHRSVRLLQGEAFFDVQRDPDHPFRVVGEYGEVEVKGTAFSVRTDEEETEVVLERGLVDVTCLCDAGGQIELRPGQSVIATPQALLSVRDTDARRKLAWRDGRISFEDVPLGDVLDELRRYYGGNIFVADSRVNRLVVTGNYRLDNIEGAIRTLADAAGVSMTRIPGGFIILR
jgi:transmembrane sensor